MKVLCKKPQDDQKQEQCLVCRIVVLHNSVFVQYTTGAKSLKDVIPVIYFATICTGMKAFCQSDKRFTK